MQELHEVGEWAGRRTCPLGCVRLPLGFDCKVVVHALVTNEHVSVTPVRRGHLRSSDELTDLGLDSTEFDGLVRCVDIVKERA